MSEALPPPEPARFRPLRPGDIYELAAPTRLARIFSAAGKYQVTWNEFRTTGPLTGGRFDHHPLVRHRRDSHAIWYGAASVLADGAAADAILGAVAETCADTHVIDRSVNHPTLALCQPTRPLRLLRLDSSWLSAAHGNAAIYAGPRGRAQAWSRAIYDHYQDLDGLYYPSSNHPRSGCLALYERGADALTSATLLLRLTDPGLLPVLQAVSDDLGWTLA